MVKLHILRILRSGSYSQQSFYFFGLRKIPWSLHSRIQFSGVVYLQFGCDICGGETSVLRTVFVRRRRLFRRSFRGLIRTWLLRGMSTRVSYCGGGKRETGGGRDHHLGEGKVPPPKVGVCTCFSFLDANPPLSGVPAQLKWCGGLCR